MITEKPGLLDEIRARFAHVEICPFEGSRIFFENAGGALRLKSVIETSAAYAGYPDNQGRDNPASKALMAAIDKGRADMRTFLNAKGGQVFVGESGTEVLFRLIRTAALGATDGGMMLGSTLEHPATRSAMARWAEVTGRKHLLAVHDDATGTVSLEEYLRHIMPDVRVATIVQTSPVTGMSVDVSAIAAAIRAKAPRAFIIGTYIRTLVGSREAFGTPVPKPSQNSIPRNRVCHRRDVTHRLTSQVAARHSFKAQL